MSSTLKKLIIVLGICIVAGGVYLIVINRPVDETVSLDQSGSEDIIRKTDKIIDDIARIDGYISSIEIFKDPRFMSLKDYSVEIPDVKAGRKNPFEPI